MKKGILFTIIALIGLFSVEAQQGVNVTWNRSEIISVKIMDLVHPSWGLVDFVNIVESVNVYSVPGSYGDAYYVKINVEDGLRYHGYSSDTTLIYIFRDRSREQIGQYFDIVEEINPETFQTIRGGFSGTIISQNGKSYVHVMRIIGGTVIGYLEITVWD